MSSEVLLSKQKLLLLDCFSPDYYVLRLKPGVRLPATVMISADCQEVTVSPERVEFRTVEQRVELVVAAVQEPKTPTFQISHRVKDGSGTATVLEGYYLTKASVKIYSCGFDHHYQLAATSSLRDFVAEYHIGSREDTCRPMPQVITGNEAARRGELWTGLAAGDSHVLACTSQGRVLAWGLGGSGQLGISPETTSRLAAQLTTELNYKVRSTVTKSEAEERMGNSVPIPTEVTGLQRVVQVACGARHSLALTQDYSVFAFGEGSAGQLGLDGLQDRLEPQLIQHLSPFNIVKVSAGSYTSFFIDSQGRLYSCGAASSGALGHGLQDQSLPSLVPGLTSIHCCSSGDSHTGVVTATGVLIMFGSAEDGRLGCTEGTKFEHPSDSFGGQKVRSVCCGKRHTHVLTENLDVYSFGSNKNGQLGLTRSDHHPLFRPIRNDYFTGKAICYLAAGADHSLALSLNGLIYSWGSNEKGQLGVNTAGKDFKSVGLPCLLEGYLREPGTLIACGLKSSYFAAANALPDSNSYVFGLWRKKLLEDQHRTHQEASYRYSLSRRDLNLAALTKRVLQEREFSLRRLSPGLSGSRIQRGNEGKSESYYEFWNEQGGLTLEDEERMVYTYDQPAHCQRHGGVTVTVFKGFHSSKDSSPNRTVEGLYTEHKEVLRTVRRYPTLKTQSLFSPSGLSPNSMLLGPGKGKQ